MYLWLDMMAVVNPYARSGREVVLMQKTDLHPMFKNSKTPVLVCRKAKEYPVIYANPSAVLFFYHRINEESTQVEKANVRLEELFGADNRQALQTMIQLIETEGAVEGFVINVRPGEDAPVLAAVSGNRIEGEDTFILYIHDYQGEAIVDEDTIGVISANAVISMILKECSQAPDANDAISKVLTIAGRYLNVSRAYNFEDLKNEYTRNT